jgi:very-short-patch-repair endonuclease
VSNGLLRYNKNLKGNSRQLRRNQTDSERALWFRLRGKQILSVQFYRQKPVGDYIVDFYAPKAKLVIEVDGSQHFMDGHVELDNQRDQTLTGLGLKVMRFNSREVLTNTDEVVEVIWRAVTASFGKSPPAPLCKRGE